MYGSVNTPITRVDTSKSIPSHPMPLKNIPTWRNKNPKYPTEYINFKPFDPSLSYKSPSPERITEK